MESFGTGIRSSTEDAPEVDYTLFAPEVDQSISTPQHYSIMDEIQVGFLYMAEDAITNESSQNA